MRLARLKAPGGLENLRLVQTDQPQPGPRDLLVRIRACSLNFHDDLVVTGKFPSADGRVPMTDGAGDVVAVGALTPPSLLPPLPCSQNRQPSRSRPSR